MYPKLSNQDPVFPRESARTAERSNASRIYDLPVHPEARPRWRPGSATLRIRAITLLVLLDVLCLVGSFATAAFFRDALIGDVDLARIVLLIVPLHLIVASNAHAYDPDIFGDRYRSAARGVRALIVAIGLMTLATFYLKTSTSLSRLTVGFGWALSALSIGAGRYLFTRHLTSIVGGNPYSTALILETGQPAPPVDFSVVIAADDFLDPERHDPLMYDRLAKALAGVHNVVISCRPERRAAWTHALKGANIQSEILISELETLAPLGINVHAGATSVVVAHGPLGLADRAVKRVFDLTVAIPALIILSPVMIAVALIIKLTGPGPVFFKQTRIGRGNEVFQVLKFRSMTAARSDHAGERSAARDDDRITRVGRFIRRTSIDELPQLLNVLEGSMSIVGPRPHALGSRAADKLFWEVDARYWHRHAAKPGLTGLAQVRGFRGATVAEDDLRNRLQADLEYLENWSIWRDLKIIFQTFQVVVHRNAY